MLDPIEDVNVDQKEKAHASRLLRRIKTFDGQLQERAKSWKVARNYVDGKPEDDGEKGLVRVNLIGSVLETLQPAIYAKAPEIAVTVDEQMTTGNYPVVSKFALTLQSALNTFLVKEGKLKQRGKSAVRGALTSTIGWVKVIYQVDRREDPLIRNRLNDTQDNIDRIRMLIDETKSEGGECAEYEAKVFELKQQVDALHLELEVVAAEGLVVDVLSPEDVIILDASIRDVDEFMQATEIAHRIKMTVGAFKTQFGKAPPKGSKKYTCSLEDESGGNVDEEDQIVHVFEVWSLKDMTVYTLIEGSESYVRPPYHPKTLGEQWYPFFGLQLRRVDGKKYPLSMVEQLIELQDEYNTRKTNAAEHRRKNLPVRLLNKGSGISDAEVTSIVNRSINTDVIGVTADPSTPLQNALGSLPEIPYNPQMYDTSDVMRDIEMVGNTQDAARGAINQAKTATEAEIMAMGMQSRTSEALDVLEDWLSDIALYSAQLLLQNLPAAVVQKRFGPDAVWPELSKEELFNLVEINIRAGSTSRPNKMRERDQWIQLLPMIQEAMEKVILFKQEGKQELVESTISLLNETLHRFDEKLDAKELLGINDEQEGMEEPQQQDPGLPPEAIEAAKQQIDAAMQEIDRQKQELEKRANEVAMEQMQVASDKKVAAAEAKALLEKITAKSEIAAATAREQVSNMLTSHMSAVQQLLSSAEQSEPEEEGEEQPDQSLLLAQAIADMNMQLQQQIGMVMESLANTNAMLAAPKQVTTPSGQVYTMSTGV